MNEAKSNTNLPTIAANTALATSAPPVADNAIIASDVIIPRILLMQGTSDFVKERKANIGDIVKNTTLEVLGTPDAMFEFVPLDLPKTGWRVETRPAGAQRWEFHSREPRNAKNDSLSWSFNADKDGNPLPDGAKSTHEWRRLKTLNLFVILPKDLVAAREEQKKAEAGELPDLSKALTPAMVEFRSTSFNAGKEVVTFFSQVKQFKAVAWKYKLKMGCTFDKNDQGSFYVFKVDRNGAGKLDADYYADVEDWVNIVKSNVNLTVAEEAADSAAEGAGNF